MVFAMAAMVALASCTKTELVENSAPTPISLKAVAGSVTKGAVTSSDKFDYDLGVFAFYNTTTNDETYFSNAKFQKCTTTVDVTNSDGTITKKATWESDPAKYWPIESSLDFIVYAPHGNASIDGKKLTVTAANNETTQDDYMYGKEYYAEFDKTDTHVPVELNHAMSLITVNFTGSTNVTVTSAVITGVYLSGKYTVDYSSQSIKPVWSEYGDGTDAVIIASDNEDALSSTAMTKEWMVVPVFNSNIISFTYKMDGMDDNAPGIPCEIDLDLNGELIAGTHYTYNIDISANEIKFTTTVEGWNKTSKTENFMPDNN